jgi:PAS domain S-box-containing protein
VVGYPPDQVLGREYSILFTNEEREANGPRLELDQAAREGHCATEAWRIRSSGEPYWCIGETTAIRDAAGGLTGFVRVARDMTRQKRAEESLSRVAADLEERVAERTRQLEATVSELRSKNEEVEALARVTACDLEEKRLMLNEIHHRVKNNLQVVQSLLKMSVRSLPAGEARSVTMTTAQRVFAMAMVHEHLYQTKDLAGISVSTYLHDLFAGVADSNAALHGQVRIAFDCDEILLNLDHAIPFGLLVNELLNNCLKHGYPDGRKGTVAVSVRRVHSAVDLVFQDDGVGLPEGFDAANCASMGLKLASSLSHQLGGKLNFSSGSGCRVEALLTRL